MAWIEMASWIVMALLLALPQVYLRKERVELPLGVLASGIAGALAGGVLARVAMLPALRVRGYSITQLIAAIFVGEVAIAIALGQRGGGQQRPLSS